MAIKSGIWEHYKGGRYEFLGVGQLGIAVGIEGLIGVAHHSETLDNIRVYLRNEKFILEGPIEPGASFLVYRALYHIPEFGDNSLWVRPEEMVEQEVAPGVQRFKPLI